jgi:hypothetical protein
MSTEDFEISLVSEEGGSIGFEHSRQNFARGGFSAPHELHRRTNGDAHSIQNLAPSGFSAPHFEQRMVDMFRRRTLKYRDWAGEFIDANLESDEDAHRPSRVLVDLTALILQIADAVAPTTAC